MKRSAQLVPRESASRHPPIAWIGARPRHDLPLRLPLYIPLGVEHLQTKRSAQLVPRQSASRHPPPSVSFQKFLVFAVRCKYKCQCKSKCKSSRRRKRMD